MMKRRSTQNWLHAVSTFILIAVVVLAVVWLAQRSLIYFPDGELPEPAAVGLPDAEAVAYQTEDGLDLDGWYLPARGRPADRTVAVFNGNAGNRSHRAMLAAMFAEYGWATLLVAPPGGVEPSPGRAGNTGRRNLDLHQLTGSGKEIERPAIATPARGPAAMRRRHVDSLAREREPGHIDLGPARLVRNECGARPARREPELGSGR
jgi:hypothetical protein